MVKSNHFKKKIKLLWQNSLTPVKWPKFPDILQNSLISKKIFPWLFSNAWTPWKIANVDITCEWSFNVAQWNYSHITCALSSTPSCKYIMSGCPCALVTGIASIWSVNRAARAAIFASTSSRCAKRELSQPMNPPLLAASPPPPNHPLPPEDPPISNYNSDNKIQI